MTGLLQPQKNKKEYRSAGEGGGGGGRWRMVYSTLDPQQAIYLSILGYLFGSVSNQHFVETLWQFHSLNCGLHNHVPITAKSLLILMWRCTVYLWSCVHIRKELSKYPDRLPDP